MDANISLNEWILTMSLLHKLGIVGAKTLAKAVHPRAIGWGHTYGPSISRETPVPVECAEVTRYSIGLKEFFWSLDGLRHGNVLDLGPASQTTANFFIERGFRLYSSDLLRIWSDFHSSEERLLESAAGGTLPGPAQTPECRAQRFLHQALPHSETPLDAILLWDRLDYLEPALIAPLLAQLSVRLASGGVIFALFHSRKPAHFRRYRVVDSMTLQILQASQQMSFQRVFQNREVQDLFPYYRRARSFVSRDQLREVLFIK